MRNRNWWMLIQTVLALGFIAGLVDFWFASDFRTYLEYGMYATTFHVLARAVNSSVLFFCVYCTSIHFIGLALSKQSRFMKYFCASATAVALIGIFPKFTSLIHAPFTSDLRFPWEVVDTKLMKMSWVTLGITTVAFFFFSWCVLRFSRKSSSVSGGDNSHDLPPTPASRQLNLVAFSLLTLVLLPNLAYAIMFSWNRITVSSKPSIIWIMLDSLRADHVSKYGYFRNTTPHIDKFAGQCTVYTRAISQATLTRLSVPSFLTSMYPQSRSNRIPLPELLNDAGYDTAAIVANPECEVIDTGAIGIMRQFHMLDDSPCKDDISSGHIVRSAINWLNKRRRRPVFLFMLFMDTHAPYRRHAGYEFGPKPRGFKDIVPIDDLMKSLSEGHQSPEHVSYMQLLYDSGIAYTDAHVGEFLDYLKRRGMYDKSLILLMADHGEEFAEHDMFFHGRDLYDNALHVPLFVKSPGQQRSAQQSEAFPLIDLYPSVAKIAGAKCGLHIQGHERDLSGISPTRSTCVFSSLCSNKALLNMRSLECDGMHFIYNFTSKRKELYNLRTDPTEQQNLSSSRPDETRGFYDKLLAQERDTAGSYAGKYFSNQELDEKIEKGFRDKLKSLGYAQ